MNGERKPIRSSTVVALELFALGAAIALVGDAAHVQAGITEYLWDIPAIWKSAVWFPFMVGGAIVIGGWLGLQIGSPRRQHDHRDALIAAVLLLGLYCLTTVVSGQPQIAANGLCWAVAIVIWLWWDDTPRALAFALAAMVLGPAVEIAVVQLGASRYLPAYDELFGVASWLMPLYFAAGAVASGIWRALER